MAAIHTERLGKHFGARRALDDVDLTVTAGESVALWGANGAGKTTALRAILGVLRYSGVVRVLGLCPLAQGRAVRREIGFVPQEASLDADSRVGETLDFFARLRGAAPGQADELLEWLELEEDLDARVGELSGGRRQRLALGVALLGDPPILLLDEPTANLDAEARQALYTRLQALRERGKTLVFTSHRVEEVRQLADRVLVLERGRLTRDVPVGEFDPESPRGMAAEVTRVERPEPRAGGRGRIIGGAGVAAGSGGVGG